MNGNTQQGIDMKKQISYSKHEQEIRRILRASIGSAESTEDVKKIFFYAVRNLLKKVLELEMGVDYEDIRLEPSEREGFAISSRLWGMPAFASAWHNSDLPHILRRMADVAIKRSKHLEKHPDKTEAKIFPIPG